MARPANNKLYEKVKNEMYQKHPQRRAYRSGLLVQHYRKRGGTYIGEENKSSGLNRWFQEKRFNQRGDTGYKNKSDVYRPTVRVNDKAPTTFKELTKKWGKPTKKKQE